MSNPTPIAELIRALAKNYNKLHVFDEAQAINIWKSLMSPEILEQTQKIEMKNGILFVKVNSPSLKNNLRLQSDEFRQKINAELSQEVVKTVAIL
jgi:predicted nucleic acid-binding Zn ribbon protein